MKRFILVLLTSVVLFPCWVIANSPVGLWKTVDDITGQPKGIVQITETKDKKLIGRIIKVFPQPNHPVLEVCSACEGEKHNQKLVGLAVVENLKPLKNKNEWGEGTILDPKTGKNYHCKIRLTDNGQKLNVRGYIGLPLFGRTQTWLKVVS